MHHGTWVTHGCPPARTVVLPRDFVGSRGCEIRFSDFFQSLWDWSGIAAAALSSCLSNFGMTRSTYASDLAALGTPRDLAVGFLAAQLLRALNNLLECIAYNIYMNYLNDPRHHFVIGPSSLLCMGVCDHIINVFPITSYIHWINDFWFSVILTLILTCSKIHLDYLMIIRSHGTGL